MTAKLNNVEKSVIGPAGDGLMGACQKGRAHKGQSCGLCSVALIVAWGQLRRNGRWAMRRMPCPECGR
jgi:hypothetical protein